MRQRGRKHAIRPVDRWVLRENSQTVNSHGFWTNMKDGIRFGRTFRQWRQFSFVPKARKHMRGYRRVYKMLQRILKDEGWIVPARLVKR